ncbi:NAD(P)H-dependent oxidoreductase [Prolixibacteraceae bacterium Z1-6]|uniref:NAD(P)H-dependent oxidoreductase n=1 Tax=Draconibacterium aestuarii TaxID=2998507 RepID=A0A9X3J9I6_9BACT|nr:NAD(P)H-dependent oxidoreductase [Prolixibacteraceae bacterium Z1-6]
MKRILILFAHPAFNKSRINKALIQSIQDLEGVTVNNLYEKYPDFFIDVKAEQKLLLEHDIIVWHHPFYWYSAPAIIKEWMDLVLEHGFAYGTKGRALEGKWAISVISTGGRKEIYGSTGSNQFSINQFLAPFNQSATLCRMKYLPPFVVHGSHTLSAEKLQQHCSNYRKMMITLRDEKCNESVFHKVEYINSIIENNV